jgi:capsular exopolysaccharide synthesis family protein
MFADGSSHALRPVPPAPAALSVPFIEASGGREPASDLLGYFVSLREHRWLVLVLVLLGTAAGMWGAGRLRPQYATTSVLWLERGEAAGARGAGSAAFSTMPAGWTGLLTSNAVLDTIVREQRLYLRATPETIRPMQGFDVAPSVLPGTYALTVDRAGANYTLRRENTVLERGVVGDSVGRRFGFRWAPPAEALRGGARMDFTVDAPADVVGALARRLRVEHDPGSSVLRLGYRADDPVRAAGTLNAVTDRLVAVASSLKRQRLEELERILGGQYRHAERELHAAERALAAFRVEAIRRSASLPGRAGPDVAAEATALATMSATLDKIRRDRAALGEVIRGASAGNVRLEALSAMAASVDAPRLTRALADAVEAEADLRELRRRFTDEGVPVQEASAALEELVQREIPAIARSVAEEFAATERSLAPRVESGFRALREEPDLAVREERLVRRMRSAEALVTEVGGRYESTRLALLSSLPDLQILDRAIVPQSPSRDLRLALVVAAALSSFLVVGLGVRAYDVLDPKVRRPEQVTHDIQLPILACVPRVRASLGTQESLGQGAVIEALRGLRLRLLHARDSAPLCLTITSPAPGDGKSFVAVNLALSFAQAGYRTLLVDGDTRRGVQHRVVRAAPRLGLVDVLSRTIDFADAVQETEHPGLSLVTAGVGIDRAAELLVGPRLEAAMTAFRSCFDVILVDSPPLAAGVDALVLAEATTNALVVLRSGATDLGLARTKLGAAAAHPVRFLGAVLNDVRTEDAFQHYGYDLSRYGARALPAGPATVRPLRTGRPS